MNLKNKKIFISLILLGLAGGFFYSHLQSQTLGLRVNDPELTLLLNVMDKYRKENLEVVWEGSQSTPAAFWGFSKEYLQRNFKLGDNAKSWIEEHCYRKTDGQIIYFKYPDGSTRPMRDVFLEELAVMRSSKS